MIAYAIMDSTFIHTPKQTFERVSKKASMLVYRDKRTPHYTQYAKQFISLAKGFEKVLLHGDCSLAKAYGADGVHLTSRQFSEIQKAKALALFVIVSTHSKKEALEAARLGADMVTFSPIYMTPNKGKPVGLECLKELSTSINIPVIALGGIVTKEQIVACRNAGAKGFASIRYFQ